jgi:hypothetical protein
MNEVFLQRLKARLTGGNRRTHGEVRARRDFDWRRRVETAKPAAWRIAGTNFAAAPLY